MGWITAIVVALLIGGVIVLFLNRFYRKATQDVALVRTGLGGRRVAMDGGFLALPFVHSVSQVNMKTACLEIERAGERAAITEDRLRMDVGLEVFVRVEPSEEGVATAAQALGGKAFRPDELKELVEGRIVDALQAIAARHSMDSLHENRGAYVREIADMVGQSVARNGLAIESVSLTSLDQTPFAALDENNAFNAVGMRRLAEVVASNRKQRAEIESDAEVAVRASELDAVKRRLLLDQEEREAQINQRNVIESREALSAAEVAERRAEGDRRQEQARIAREQEVRSHEIARDRELRRLDIEARLGTELRQRDNAIEIARKQAEEALALAEAESARQAEILAREATETAKARAAAERMRALARIRAEEQSEVDAERTRSEVETIIERARAESQARDLHSAATRAEMIAVSEGKGALFAAENSQSQALIDMKLAKRKLDRLPEIVSEMVKPAEKIDSIRIHQVSGLGAAASGGAGDDSGAGRPLVNQAVDGVLGMALQLPAVKRLGEEIGLNISAGIDGLSAGLQPAEMPPDEPPTSEDESDT